MTRHILDNGTLRMTVLARGAAVQDLRLHGVPHPLVLGLANPDDYAQNPNYFGVVVGRCANRIGNATAMIDGKIYHLDKNEHGRQTLHGGRDGSSHRLWSVVERGKTAITLRDTLPDGHMGFPGRLTVEITYRLDRTSYDMMITALTDRPTLANFSAHSYFNLSGAATIDDHKLHIPADHIQPVDDFLIPTGAPVPLDTHPLDFRRPRLIPEPLDHSFVTTAPTKTPTKTMRHLATLSTDTLALDLHSTEPALQVFSATGLSTPTGTGLEGRTYSHRAGLALEPQQPVDAINSATPDAVLLRPDETYRHHSRYTLKPAYIS